MSNTAKYITQKIGASVIAQKQDELGICLICGSVVACEHAKPSKRPVLQCEEFAAGENDFAQKFSGRATQEALTRFSPARFRKMQRVI
jgi:hypothetical protein